MNGIHEVEGSIPFGSTNYVIMHEKDCALFTDGHFFFFSPFTPLFLVGASGILFHITP